MFIEHVKCHFQHLVFILQMVVKLHFEYMFMYVDVDT